MKIHFRFWGVRAFGVWLLCGLAGLRGQVVVNGYFESPVVDGWQYNPATTGANPWLFEGESGISAFDGPFSPPGATTGQMAFMQSFDPDSVFSQSISFGAAGTYALTYDEGTRNGYPPLSYTITLTRDSDSSVVFTANDSSAADQAFTPTTHYMTLSEGGSYTLKFAAVFNGQDNDTVFDNITITAVPEPAVAAALAGLAAFAWVGVRRRFRRGQLNTQGKN